MGAADAECVDFRPPEGMLQLRSHQSRTITFFELEELPPHITQADLGACARRSIWSKSRFHRAPIHSSCSPIAIGMKDHRFICSSHLVGARWEEQEAHALGLAQPADTLQQKHHLLRVRSNRTATCHGITNTPTKGVLRRATAVLDSISRAPGSVQDKQGTRTDGG
jgi:hypothetical protein